MNLILIRRIHMYLALFLIPWMVMYALGAFAMNHHLHKRPVWEQTSVQTYKTTFAEGTSRKAIARQIIRHLNIDGQHTVRPSADGERLIILRESIPSPRRITYTPGDGKLVIETEVFKVAALLAALHDRGGYKSEYVADDAWAVMVDVVIVAVAFWVFSGLWMWWHMSTTRRAGALAAAGGATLLLILAAVY